MRTAAAGVLVKPNADLLLFRSSSRRGRIFMHGDRRANYLVRLRLAVPSYRVRSSARMRSGARPDTALLHRTTHRLKVSLRRAGRSIGETSATPRALSCRAGWKACRCPRWPNRAEDVETLSLMITAPPSMRVFRRRARATLPNKGFLVFGTK